MDAYKNRDHKEAMEKLCNFQSFLRLAPEGMFDELKEHYLKKARLAHELYLKYKEDTAIDSKEIDWDKIIL